MMFTPWGGPWTLTWDIPRKGEKQGKEYRVLRFSPCFCLFVCVAAAMAWNEFRAFVFVALDEVFDALLV